MSTKKQILIVFLFLSFSAKANNMLIQNVTKVGNNPSAKTIQLQFDISWENSWRDQINWDAAWIFVKYKDVNGLWNHALLNNTGFNNGTGTANTIQVTSDKVGAWVYRSAQGSGNFNVTSIQLQWNYGLNNLTDVTGLEVRIFAVEMVYVPEGDFNVAMGFYDVRTSVYDKHDSIVVKGGGHPVINNRLSPVINYKTTSGDFVSVRIKGDVGIDTNNDGLIDNISYPLGYKSFYCYKYELTEQQYADFFSILTPIQQTNIGIPVSTISELNGLYFTSEPNRACANATENMVLAYAAWSGVRPMSILEFNKASYGPLQPIKNALGNWWYGGYPAWGDAYSFSYPNIYDFSNTNPAVAYVGSMGSSNTSRSQSGASYYGIMDMTGNVIEPVVRLSYLNFSSDNGSGSIPHAINSYGVKNWESNMLLFIDQAPQITINGRSWEIIQGFRYVRSAE